jgi:hypothetical protein
VALPERALHVSAFALQGIEAAVRVGDRDRAPARLDGTHLALGNVLGPGDGDVLGHGAEATKTLSSHPAGRYPPGVATILLCGVDLFFRGKLEALLPEHRLITVDHTESPDLVIVDISRVDPEEVADAYPDVPILGYTNHTDTSGLRAAHAAGFDQVVVKSALVEHVHELVDQLTPSIE